MDNQGFLNKHFTCNKCGSIASTSVYKYCVDCGTPFGNTYEIVEGVVGDTTYNIVEVLDSSLYKNINYLAEQFFGENNVQYIELISIPARRAYFMQLPKMMIDILYSNHGGNEKVQELIRSSKKYLSKLYLHIIVHGYCAWIAEQNLKDIKIHPAICTNHELFFEELNHMHGVVYREYIDCLFSTKDNVHISKDMAFTITTLSTFQFNRIYNAINKLSALDSIYDNIQGTCFEALVGGYAIAIVDANYRN